MPLTLGSATAVAAGAAVLWLAGRGAQEARADAAPDPLYDILEGLHSRLEVRQYRFRRTQLEFMSEYKGACPEIAAVIENIETEAARSEAGRRRCLVLCRRAMLRRGFYGLWLRARLRDIAL